MNETTNEINRTTLFKTFAALVIVAFLLRIFYAGHLFEDDGLWFTAAEEMLRGKTLYSQIYFDKPPALPLAYALLFKLFGAHILTIRLFAAAYSVAVAFVLYLFGALLYDKRLGLLAAAMFVVGSTTYTTGQFQGFNTDSMMTLPYTLAAYWFVRSVVDPQLTRARRAWMVLASGIAVGVALQTNPKAIFDLLFFALCLSLRSLGSRVWGLESKTQTATEPQTANCQLPTAYSLLLTAGGVLLGALPFWIYIVATKSWEVYWLSVWEWGRRYASYYSWDVALAAAVRQSIGYFSLNSIFLVGLLYVIVTTIRRFWQNRRKDTQTALAANSTSPGFFHADAILLLWFAASYVGMSVGGRFFGHYFLQILPNLCLLAGRGFTGLVASLKSTGNEKRVWRYAVFALLIIGAIVTLVRYHTRTVILAADWARGTKSALMTDWFYERVQREDRAAAAIVKDVPETREAIEGLGLEALRQRKPAREEKSDGENYLFVWGYRPEIYYWSGLVPASRYLSTQLLTGVPADVHYFNEGYTAILDEKTTAAARAQLVQDLQETRPQFIIDELAAYNSALAMDCFPELKELLNDYKMIETDVKVFVYRLRSPKVKSKNRPPAGN